MEVVREYVPVIVNIDAVQKNVNDLFLIIQIIRVAVLELTDPFNNLLLRVFRPDQFCLHDADIQITVSGFEQVKTFLCGRCQHSGLNSIQHIFNAFFTFFQLFPKCRDARHLKMSRICSLIRETADQSGDAAFRREFEERAEGIAAHGALVSDFARGTAPVAFTFLRRNRIIAGLADATLLAESYRRGGGLITMQLASSYNRDTFAIPGRLSDASFEGNNRLIAKQEAVLVADEETIPVTLGWAEALCRQHRSPLLRPGDTPQQRAALQLLQQRGPLSVDAVAALMSIGVDAASVLLLELEMAGRVGGDGNNFFVSL